MRIVKYNKKGFALLEVLISVVILAIGMLGIAAMQATAVRYNHSAELRSIAIIQIENITDRMLANYQGVRNGHYNNLSGIPGAQDCSGGCSSAGVAQMDANEWNTANQTLLPSGQGTITRSGDRFRVTIYWDNERTGATGLDCGGDPEVDLQCLIMEIQI